jgi:V-type H+-transporting ATPase subunit a
MKISVIIGVFHMSLGVFLKANNDIYFKNYKQLIFVFLPQIIFLWALFGYMDFLIIFKWLVHWDTQDTALAPSIISQIIAIPLAFGST